MFAGGLHPSNTATVVDGTGGDVLVTDGPFAESKEQIGGFWVDRGRRPGRGPRPGRPGSRACRAPVEVRPSRTAGGLDARWPRQTRVEASSAPSHGQVVASLARRFGDLDLAEEAAQEAFVEAVERWPDEGVPPNPGGWLTTTARNRAMDRIRRESTYARHEEADDARCTDGARRPDRSR